MATEEKTGYDALDNWERTVINSSNSTIRSDGKVALRGENAMRLNQLLQYRTGLLKDRERLESELAFDSRLDPEQTINGQKVKLSDEERKKLENKLSGINSEITGIESGSIGVSNPKVVQGQTVTEIEEGAPLPYTIQPTTSTTTTTTQQSTDVVGVVTSTTSTGTDTVGEVVTVVDPPTTGITTSATNGSVGVTTGITPKPISPKYAEGKTQEEIKKLVEDEVESQIERLKDYYRRGFPTFEVTGGNTLEKHDLSEYQLDTKSGQGILFTNTGNAKVLGNASLELISNGKKSGGGGFDKDGEAGVVIYAKDGVIHIESVRGTVNIKARKNIQLEAGEDINLIAGKDIKLDAGEDMIHEVGGDYTEDVTDNKRIVCTGTMTLHSEKQDIETSCGTDPTLYQFHEDLKTEWEIVKEIADSPNNPE